MAVTGHAKNVRVEWSGNVGSNGATKCYVYDSASTGRYLTTTDSDIETKTPGSGDAIIRYSASQGGTVLFCFFVIDVRDLHCF